MLRPRAGAVYRVTAVAYSSTVDQTDLTPCMTAAGITVRPGVIATNFLPLGTVLRIQDEAYVVADRMNKRYNGKYIVDVWHPTRAQAKSFGAKLVDVEVLGVADLSPLRSRVLERDLGVPPTAAPLLVRRAPIIAKRVSPFRRLLGVLLAVRVVLPEDVDCLTDL
jgi:3D (Asp-Asp-Asp) domain-containing protein